MHLQSWQCGGLWATRLAFRDSRNLGPISLNKYCPHIELSWPLTSYGCTDSRREALHLISIVKWKIELKLQNYMPND